MRGVDLAVGVVKKVIKGRKMRAFARVYRYVSRRKAIARGYRRLQVPVVRWGMAKVEGVNKLLKTQLYKLCNRSKRCGGALEGVRDNWVSKFFAFYPYCSIYLVVSKTKYNVFKEKLGLSDKPVRKGNFLFISSRDAGVIFGRLSALNQVGLGSCLVTYAATLEKIWQVGLELESSYILSLSFGCWGRFVSPVYFLNNVGPVLGLFSTTVCLLGGWKTQVFGLFASLVRTFKLFIVTMQLSVGDAEINTSKANGNI